MGVKGLNRIASSPAILPPNPAETNHAPERFEVIPSREHSRQIGHSILAQKSVQDYIMNLAKFDTAFSKLNDTAARKANEFRNNF